MIANDGLLLTLKDNFNPSQAQAQKRGLFALEKADLFNLLASRPIRRATMLNRPDSLAAAYCEQRRAMLVVDPPSNWVDVATAQSKFTDTGNDFVGAPRATRRCSSRGCASPTRCATTRSTTFAPCGAVAGVIARTDATRGVWKAPAGIDADARRRAASLSVAADRRRERRAQPAGHQLPAHLPGHRPRGLGRAHAATAPTSWPTSGSTSRCAGSALFLEESLYRGTQWVVFEPNDEPLWAQIRLNVGAFMQNLFRQGAFQGTTPREAYFVKCDSETTTQNDINLGIVNIVVGFAPLKPAEFVIIKIQQIAGQIADLSGGRCHGTVHRQRAALRSRTRTSSSG